MKKAISVLFFLIIFFFCIENYAYANIAPLKIKDDGVEPLENSPVKIESAEITVQPDSSGFKFSCNYVLKGLVDSESLTIGIPGDLGYSLEAGYIEGINGAVNGRPVKFKTYNTAKALSEVWKTYNSPLNFKWHTLSLPVKKDSVNSISVTYNINWRIFEQDKSTPYYIVPFLMSTDKLFGSSIGTYKIRYLAGKDDIISPPDTKVMINFMLEPNIISQAILRPSSTREEIVWEFKNPEEFQDFRLIVLSFRKLSTEFAEAVRIDPSTSQEIKWAILNNNLEKLADTFGNIANKNIVTDLKGSELGTAAYLSAEYHFRLGKFDKALEMLLLPNKTNIWPTDIKYQYINSISLNEKKNYEQSLEELKKLQQYKDFVLISGYADKQIKPVSEALEKQEQEKRAAEEAAKKAELTPSPTVTPTPHDNDADNGKDIKYLFIIIPLCVIILILLWIIRTRLKRK